MQEENNNWQYLSCLLNYFVESKTGLCYELKFFKEVPEMNDIASKIVKKIEHIKKNEKEITADAMTRMTRILNSIPLDRTTVVWYDSENPSDNYLKVKKGSEEDRSDTEIFIMNPQLIYLKGISGFEVNDINNIIFANTILNRVKWIEEMNISPEIS